MFLSSRNGTFDALYAVVAQTEPKIPGTHIPVSQKYTGIEAVDRHLMFLVMFFTPVVDGKSEAVMLFCGFACGQFGAAWLLIMLEGLRKGNLGKVVSWYVLDFSLWFSFVYSGLADYWAGLAPWD